MTKNILPITQQHFNSFAAAFNYDFIFGKSSYSNKQSERNSRLAHFLRIPISLS